MQTIVPHLWLDREAVEAARFYASVFPEGNVTRTTVLHNTPSGDCDVVSFEIMGCAFQAIGAGPLFRPNPSISFMVNFDPSQDRDATTRIDEIWGKLSEGGTVRMPIDRYPFSERYGWIEDRYSVSWQLILTNPEGEERPLIIPSLLFVGDNCGKAEEASDFYISVFRNSKRGAIARYPAGMAPDQEGTIMFTDFTLEGQWFAAMDSALEHAFTFNEAVSLMVFCDTQQQIDDYWKQLSAMPEAEQCGWLKDRYGVSWQIVPRILDAMMRDEDRGKVDRVMQAVLQMKKLDIGKLEEVYKGR
jgi:predicted 3-demethylubiquinone-9 3-methyltransferase (glyoxalase superfamily)